MDAMTFQQIKKHFGSVEKARLALRLGSRQTLYNWRDKGIPIDQQLEIERVTRGKLRANVVRFTRPATA